MASQRCTNQPGLVLFTPQIISERRASIFALLALTFSKLSALHSPPERVCCSDLRRGKHLSANSNHIIQPPHTHTHSHTVAMVSLFGYQRAWQRGFNQPTTLYLSLWMQATRKRRQAGLITRRQSGALLCDWLEVFFCCCLFRCQSWVGLWAADKSRVL